MQPNANRDEPIIHPTPAQYLYLYRRGVQHNANRSTERARGKGGREFGSDDARVAVWTSHFAPDDSNLGATDLLLSFVDVCDTLTKVEVGSLGVIDALDLDQACAGVGCVLVSNIRKVATLDV